MSISKTKDFYISIFLMLMMFLINLSLSINPLNKSNFQLHRYYYGNDPYYGTSTSSGRGMGLFSAIIVSVACGICCFCAILYYFKLKR